VTKAVFIPEHPRRFRRATMSKCRETDQFALL